MSENGILMGICISEKRGTEKYEVKEAVIVEGWGLEGDAHGGNWHRQISLLSYCFCFSVKNTGIPRHTAAAMLSVILSEYGRDSFEKQ